jgi:HlyD family secretion protein
VIYSCNTPKFVAKREDGVYDDRCGQKVYIMNYETSLSRADGKPVANELGYNTAPDSDARPRRSLLIPILGLLAIAAILAGTYYAFTRNSSEGVGQTAAKPATTGGAKADKQAPNVTVIVPGRTTVTNIINATGTLAARFG